MENRKFKTNKEYVELDGTRCPACNSTQLEGGSIDVDQGYAWQEIYCHDCHLEYQDVYELRSYYIPEVRGEFE